MEVGCLNTQDVQAAISNLPEAEIVDYCDRATSAAGHTVVKTIGLYILPTKRPLVAILHLHRNIDLARLQQLLQLPLNHRLRLAQHTELLEDFGFPAGSVGPFGLRRQGETTVVVDEEVRCGPPLFPTTQRSAHATVSLRQMHAAHVRRAQAFPIAPGGKRRHAEWSWSPFAAHSPP